MDLSKVKIEAYEFFALLAPGFIVLAYAWVILRGWQSFAIAILSLSAPALALLFFVSFAFGHLVQELGDRTLKAIKGPRFFKASRDAFWLSPDSELLRQHLQAHYDVSSVDVAFDLCLTRVQAQFTKRDLFLATADLARSMFLLSFLAIVPLCRVVAELHRGWLVAMMAACAGIAILCLCAVLSWTRMVRFRELSERPVFHAYLAERLSGVKALGA